MNLPPFQHIIAIVIILFALRVISGLLGNISPVFVSLPAQIVIYGTAAIVFIIWLYRSERSKHFNPHQVEINALTKKHHKKPEVWTMPEDSSQADHNNHQSKHS